MFNFKKKDKPIPSYSKLLQHMSMIGEVAQTPSYSAPTLPNGVAPDEALVAMDGFCQELSGYMGVDPQFYSSAMTYPQLANLSQSSEYRAVAETNAEEMTREWGEVKGGDDKVVELIEKELERLGVRNLMRKHIENDHLYGGSQMFIRIKGQQDKKDLPLMLDERGIAKGSLEGFTIIEPYWSTPSLYNTTDPTEPDFFKPSMWYVQGGQVHSDRLLTLVMRPVADILKPAYNFRGISMTQLMLPYVQRYQRTVDSISDVIHSFSLTGFKTDMSNLLSGQKGGMNELLKRIEVFTTQKNNQGLMVLDKEADEEFFQFNTPLSNLDALQNQALEQIAFPAKIPVIKLFGQPPAGLSATSDGEIRVYYDHISAMQEAHLLPQMQVILKLVQLSLFGKVDEKIFFKFNPLYQLDAVEQATVNLTKAQTAQIYMEAGILDQEVALQALSEDENSDYTGKADDVVISDRYESIE